MKTDFDFIKSGNAKSKIEYGIIKGNNTIVFVKAGANGSLYGYENKYLKMAVDINEKHGCSVICSSNPMDSKTSMEDGMSFISAYCKEEDFIDYQIYYIGISNGGNLGIWCGAQYPQIKRMLLINAPLTMNLHKTKEGITAFKGEKIVFVYGSLDASSKYIELIDGLSDKVRVEVIEGADHLFTGKMTEFLGLPEKYLL